MGLILPQTVEIRIGAIPCKYYKEKGYKCKFGEIIEVNVLDLYPGSHTMVKCICDICGKETKEEYRYVIENINNGTSITCRDILCKNKKRENTCIEKYKKKHVLQVKEIRDKGMKTWKKNYGDNITNPMQVNEIKEKCKATCRRNWGVDNPGQSEEIKNKIKETNNRKHGCDWSFQNREVKEKSQQTWQKNYGKNITNPGQAQVVKDKRKATWKNNYGEGIENPFQVESVKEKSKQTLLKNYGVEHPLQSKEIKNKALDSFQFNGTGPNSRAQRYINHILNGTLNKHICGSLADIYIEKENIIIEYDGSGHFLNDKMNGNKTPTKESFLYEKEREDKIINNGYRMIRFIATKDRIPSDEVILNLIEGFKNSDFKIIRINFEEGTIDRDYEEKWYCNFGELRRITKEDLEQFEKQKENTSEN